jgi:hypothetical protein
MDTNDGLKQRPVGLISIDTKVLFDRLTKLEIGEVASYEELSSLVGNDVRNGSRWALQSARRKSLHENGAVFGAIPKIGIKRLTNDETADTGHHYRGKVRRAAQRGARIQATVDLTKLSNAKRTESLIHLSYFGIVAHVSKEKQIRRLESAVEKADGPLPLEKTLKAFEGS